MIWDEKLNISNIYGGKERRDMNADARLNQHNLILDLLIFHTIM